MDQGAGYRRMGRGAQQRRGDAVVVCGGRKVAVGDRTVTGRWGGRGGQREEEEKVSKKSL